jgi:hypothetical protein
MQESFSLNIHNLQTIHQVISSYGLQAAPFGQILARIGRQQFSREISA